MTWMKQHFLNSSLACSFVRDSWISPTLFSCFHIHTSNGKKVSNTNSVCRRANLRNRLIKKHTEVCDFLLFGIERFQQRPECNHRTASTMESQKCVKPFSPLWCSCDETQLIHTRIHTHITHSTFRQHTYKAEARAVSTKAGSLILKS